MLRHFAPALAVSALLLASAPVFAADTSAPANQTAAGTNSGAAMPGKPVKKKLHHVAKKKKKATNVAAKKTTTAPAATSAAPATKTN